MRSRKIEKDLRQQVSLGIRVVRWNEPIMFIISKSRPVCKTWGRVPGNQAGVFENLPRLFYSPSRVAPDCNRGRTLPRQEEAQVKRGDAIED